MAHSAANAATASAASAHAARMPRPAAGADPSARPSGVTSSWLALADNVLVRSRPPAGREDPTRRQVVHACSSTPRGMTSALRVMSNECHVDGRILGWMRVLVVEDHVTLAGRIAQGLRQAGMAVDASYDGAAALEAAAATAYDVIVLDRDLPLVHGDQVCRRLAGSGPRILMLTAAAQVEDRVDGLELGADDYLGKPFVFAELVARVRALSRRSPSAPPVLRRGDLTVDRARHRAGRGSRPLSLTRKEFGILEMLLAADGALVSAEELLEHVWDAEVDPFSNIVSVTMTRLRRKLGDPPLIDTVVGKGYRM